MGSPDGNPLRLALLLASIHTGSSEALWSAVADTAEASGQALFVFPGGRLDAQGEFEYLRNSIYRLVNPDTVDAVISWGSSMVGTVDRTQAITFHRQYASLPMVCIALAMQGVRTVTFDAYQGMRSLVLHCINDHHCRKIAFIRGPENHESAQQRYRAYVDALEVSGLSVEEELVSSPHPWHEGEAALTELIERRHLVPGKDFTMVCCASDLLMLNAAKVLQHKGYRIPEDLGIVGFNDSAESRFLPVPGTTVRVPFSDLGKVAHEALMHRLKGVLENHDIILPANPVIRSSCGCSILEHGDGAVEGRFDRDSLRSWIHKRYSLSQEMQEAYLEPLLDTLYRGPQDSGRAFLSLARRVLERYFSGDGEPSELVRILGAIVQLEDLDPDHLQNMVKRVKDMALETQSRIANRRNYENIRQAELLNAFKCDLLKAWDRESLITILSQHLPALGISQAHLVMDESESRARYVGGYHQDRLSQGAQEIFPSHRLLPQPIESSLGPGVHLVQPLFIENQALGYLVFTISDRNSLKYEELRSSISSALKGVLLFEEMAKAKEVAERAEQAELTFFAAMGESIKEPLRSFIGKVAALAAKEGPHASEPLERLQHDMQSHLDHIRLLFDQTLAQVGSLEVDRLLVDVLPPLRLACERASVALACEPRIPRIIGDERRLMQIFSLLVDALRVNGTAVRVCVRCTATALMVQFDSDAIRSPSIPPLVESLVLLHHGSFRIAGGSCTILFPWPHLSDHPGTTDARTLHTLLVLTDSSQADADAVAFAKHLSLEVRPLRMENLKEVLGATDPSAMLYWDATASGMPHYLAILEIFRHHTHFSIPVAVFGTMFDGHLSVVSAVEAAIRSRRMDPILLWDDADTLPLCTNLATEVLTVHDVRQLEELAGKISCACMIIRGLPMQLVRQIRSSRSCAPLPLIAIIDEFPDDTLLRELAEIPHVLICHACISSYPEFCERVRDIASGNELLPSHTGILVKRAQRYLAEHGCGPIARWKVAGSVNTSEDYLTRIFKRELGMSPWEYLNRYRIEQSVRLLRKTDLPLSEIALRCGFQDQAYYCRVFRRLKRTTPTSLRNG